MSTRRKISKSELNAAALDLVASRFRILGEAMRLRILMLLSDGELTVGQLTEKLGATQANVSKHLGVLLDAGVVKRRKEATSAFYAIADSSVLDLCSVVCDSLSDQLAARQQAVAAFRPGE